MRRTHKYNATKTEVDGIKFDSKAEARRYKELKLLESVGDISKLELQPKYELQESFTHNGKRIRSINYVADFFYLDKDGNKIVEDVKGLKTDVYLLKKKMFQKKYPDLTHIET